MWGWPVAQIPRHRVLVDGTVERSRDGDGSGDGIALRDGLAVDRPAGEGVGVLCPVAGAERERIVADMQLIGR